MDRELPALVGELAQVARFLQLRCGAEHRAYRAKHNVESVGVDEQREWRAMREREGDRLGL